MTLFFHVPELEAGMAEAQKVLHTDEAGQNELERSKAEMIKALEDMLTFAKTNLQEILTLMGFNSIEELNQALRDYNSLNLSLTQIFPAFSEPMLTEALARVGLGNTTNEADYGLFISALKDSLQRKYEQYFTNNFLNAENMELIRQELAKSDVQNTIAADVIAELFTGQTLDAVGIIDFGSGRTDFSNIMNKFMNIANKAVRLRGATTTNTRTYMSVYDNILIPFLEKLAQSNLELFTNEESYQVLEDVLKQTVPDTYSKEIIRDRIKRGGITISAKNKTTSNISGNTATFTTYLDQLQVNVDKNIFDIANRPLENGKKQSIEKYVNNVCDKYPAVREQLIKNIQNTYWNIIISYLPKNIQNPLLQDEFNRLIETMGQPAPAGNIGWFFSQGTTKAGGAGMFGEIAGMIYLSILCPKLKPNLEWKGGVTGEAKPPADIAINTALRSYGIQVKNYTSGTTLSHDYNLKIKNLIDEAARDNSKNTKDLMTLQAMSELGITEDEVEAVQNVIIANSFNVPYKNIGGHIEQVSSVAGFNDARSKLNETYLQATRFMALISIIMHRIQYQEEVTRQINATKEQVQLQNTLWLINGSFFVSSVQILEELKQYIESVENRFFSISASVRVSGDNLPSYLKEGRYTIVEYLNTNADLRKSSLSYLTAKIGTNYKMSAFNPR